MNAFFWCSVSLLLWEAGGISEKRVLGTFSLMTRPKSKCVMLRSIGTSGGMRSPAARVLSLLLELTPLYNVKLASSYAAWRGGGGGRGRTSPEEGRE